MAFVYRGRMIVNCKYRLGFLFGFLAILAVLHANFDVNLTRSALAQQADGGSLHTIERIVDDQPISSYDVEARLRMVLTTAGQPPSEESLQRIRAQVLQTLIDERIQLQEAESLGITVQDQEIQEAIATIEENNRMPEGALVSALTERGVDINTLISQIRATIAWRKVISQRVRGRVQISEEDIDAYLTDLRQKGGTEYLLSEIFIAAPTPQDLSQARSLAQDLRQQVRNGTQFTALARQFSQAPTAAAGGDLGWIEAEQLDSRLTRALDTVPVGQVSAPVEVDDGYYLLALRDRREFGAEGQQQLFYDLRRYYAPFDPSASDAAKVAVLRRAERARSEIAGCSDIEPVAERYGAQGIDMGAMRLQDLPAPLRPYVEGLEVGGKTQALPLTDGILILMLCNKETRTLELPDREQVRETLLNRRLDLEARRYLRDLRQNAMIETRS